MDKKLTIKKIYQATQAGQKLPCVACYDYLTAKTAFESGIEILLVGDSAAQHLLGYDSTRHANMDFMVEITAAVRRAAPNGYVIADMPFLSYQCGIEKAVENAGRFITQSEADIVKIEADKPYLPVIKAVSQAGIPVMAHIGIRPQTNIFSAQAKNAQNAIELYSLAHQMVEHGACMILLEGIAAEIAEKITQNLDLPVIGCGSGPACDINVLIAPDILNLSEGKKPKFSAAFGEIGKEMTHAFKKFSNQISSGKFPDHPHCYHISPDELEKFKKYLKEKTNN